MINRTKLSVIAVSAVLAVALTGCGEESNDTEWVEKTFGDITISLPGEFQDVNQSNGVYTCAGPGSSVTVSEATPASIGPEDWTQELLEDNLGIMYGATYTDISLLSFEGNVDINGDPAVCFDLQGTNSSGKVRIIRNVYLFNDTIRANICFGKPDATEEEMIEAAKKARCHDFIMDLPNGYDTVVGEGGGTLSGGEKQRISIARAILKNAPIIILDEATASIDPENEHFIQQAISELTRGKTIITIAHRLATVQNADQILVVEDGRIAECGTHEELIRKEGLYKKFTEIREQAEGWRIETR